MNHTTLATTIAACLPAVSLFASVNLQGPTAYDASALTNGNGTVEASWFGADPTKLDNYTNLQNAINWAAAAHRKVHIAGATNEYAISAPLTNIYQLSGGGGGGGGGNSIPSSNLVSIANSAQLIIEGDGKKQTIITCATNFPRGQPLLVFGQSTNYPYNGGPLVVVRDMGFDGQTWAAGIGAQIDSNSIFENLYVTAYTNFGISITNSYCPSVMRSTFSSGCVGSVGIQFVTNSADGNIYDGSAEGARVQNNEFQNGASGIGMFVPSGGVEGNHFSSMAGTCIDLSARAGGCLGCQLIMRNYAENCGMFLVASPSPSMGYTPGPITLVGNSVAFTNGVLIAITNVASVQMIGNDFACGVWIDSTVSDCNIVGTNNRVQPFPPANWTINSTRKHFQMGGSSSSQTIVEASWFGANPTKFIDNYPMLQAALNFAASNGFRLHIAGATNEYLISAPLVYTYQYPTNVSVACTNCPHPYTNIMGLPSTSEAFIEGDGKEATVISCFTNFPQGQPLFILNASTNDPNLVGTTFLQLRNIGFDGQTWAAGVSTFAGETSTIEDCLFLNYTNYAMSVTNPLMSICRNWIYYGETNSWAIMVLPNQANTNISGGSGTCIRENDINWGCNGIGLFTAANGAAIRENVIQNMSGLPVSIRPCNSPQKAMTFEHNYFEGVTQVLVASPLSGVSFPGPLNLIGNEVAYSSLVEIGITNVGTVNMVGNGFNCGAVIDATVGELNVSGSNTTAAWQPANWTINAQNQMIEMGGTLTLKGTNAFMAQFLRNGYGMTIGADANGGYLYPVGAELRLFSDSTHGLGMTLYGASGSANLDGNLKVGGTIEVDQPTNSTGTTVKGQLPVIVNGTTYYLDLKK